MTRIFGMRDEKIEMICKALGSRFKSARKSRYPQDDQRKFSRRIGVSRETLRKMEHGDASVSLASYLRAADILDCLEGFNGLFAGDEISRKNSNIFSSDDPPSLFEEDEW